MKKILLYDTIRNFTSDMEMQLLLNREEIALDLVTRNSLEKLKDDIEKVQPDEIVISVPMLSSRPNWDLNIPVISYARTAQEVSESEEKRHIPCYGIITRADTLLNLIAAGKTMNIQTEHSSNQPVAQPSAQILFSQESAVQFPIQHVASVQQSMVNQSVNPQIAGNIQNPHAADYSGLTAAQEFSPNTQHPMEFGQMQRGIPGDPNASYSYIPYPVAEPLYGNGMPLQDNCPGKFYPYPPEGSHGNNEQNPANGQNFYNQYMVDPRYFSQNRQMQNRQMQNGKMHSGMSGYAYEVERDMGNVQRPAKMVAVYAAKGGVGKTTITCNLSTYLALTEHGRDRYKVCIVDFNIDFGDVATTLGLDPNRGCMTQWANDIKERLNGITPEDNGKYTSDQLNSISYTEQQIKNFLQRQEETGLYVLLAPISNEDSMFIAENEIEVILTNLINKGGFDFIICDTGNNTRDSSFIPLTKADEIYVVMTQAATTANCNAGFMNTMHKIGFDLNKIHILINMAMSYKSTGISIDEIEEAFINPYTKKPYDIIGTLKNYDDVRISNNMQRPLVYNSKHEYTRCIGEIANKLIGDTSILKSKKTKKSFWRRRN